MGSININFMPPSAIVFYYTGNIKSICQAVKICLISLLFSFIDCGKSAEACCKLLVAGHIVCHGSFVKLSVSFQIEVARSFGDLSENADYDAARDHQARVEARAGEPRRADITVTLLDKPAVRLPEAYWVRFDVPGLRRLFAWKTGERIDLMDVAPRGARRQHGVGEAVELVTDAGTLRIRPHQAFLLNVGREMGLSYDVGLPSLEGGVQFCLLNNFWGTNFQMWNEGSLTYRFQVEVL